MYRFVHRAFISKLPVRTFATTALPAGRGAALAAALRQIESSFGKGSVMQLGKGPIISVPVIRTGSLTLDHALGVGGLPKGRVVEIFGPESSGKTTLALHVIAEAQKDGGTCCFIDAEHALSTDYAKAVGVDLDALYLSQPDSGEQALEIADTLVRSGGVDVVVIDSVAALVPKAELEGDMGDAHIALQARLMSQVQLLETLREAPKHETYPFGLRLPLAGSSQTDVITVEVQHSHNFHKSDQVEGVLTALIIFTCCTAPSVHQVTVPACSCKQVGVMFGSPDVTSGGNALKFYASIRMEIRRIGQVCSALIVRASCDLPKFCVDACCECLSGQEG
jgi:recombination protein RecA